MTTLYFDESGYSGPNLLDQATTYYACAALRITEDRANELKKLHFPDKTSELKFAEMKAGRNFYRSRDLVKTLLDAHAVRVTVIDKRFALSAKLFEWIAEPGLSGRVDLYSEGFLPQTANTFHTLASIEQPAQLLAVHEAYQAVIKQPQDSEVGRLIHALEGLSGVPREIADGLLLPPLRGEYEELFEDHGMTEGLLGILLSAAWQNLMRWGAVIPVRTPIQVVYDEHSVMEAERAMWDQITSKKLRMHANGFDVRLDHAVTTRFGDSKKEVALQLADLVAGFSAFAIQTAAKVTERPVDRVPPGLVAHELLTASQYQEDQPLVTVASGRPERFSGWQILDF